MARYYFDIHDGMRVIADLVGGEFTSDEEAIARAREIARHERQARADPLRLSGRDLVVTREDSKRIAVLRLLTA